MKKITQIICALMAALLLMLPLSAAAEPSTAYVIRISDPRAERDGQVLYTCTGLAAQLAYCESPDSSLAQLILDIFSDGEGVGSAMLQLDDMTNLTGIVGGMDSAYTINIAETMQLFITVLLDGTGCTPEELISAFTDPESWALESEAGLMAVLESYLGMLDHEEMPAETTEDGDVISYTRYAGDVMPLLTSVFEYIESDPVFGLMFHFLDMPLGVVTGILGDMDVVLDSEIVYGKGADGAIYDINCVIAIYTAGDFIGTIYFDIYSDKSNPEHIVSDEQFKVLDAEGELIAMETTHSEYNEGTYTSTNYSSTLISYTDTSPFMDEVSGHLNGAESTGYTTSSGVIVLKTGETEDSFSFEFTEESPLFSAPATIKLEGFCADLSDGSIIEGSMAMNVEGILINFDLFAETFCDGPEWSMDSSLDMSIEAPGMFMTSTEMGLGLSIEADTEAGAYTAFLSIDDGYSDDMGIGLSLLPRETANADAIYSGVVSLWATDGRSTEGYSADVDVLTTEFDTATLYVDPAAAINILSLSDAEGAAVMAEIESIINDVISGISREYRGFPWF